MRVLVLGNTGMLGNAVYSYLETQKDVEVFTITARYPDALFFEQIESIKADYIINCIGAIPQHSPSPEAYRLLNEELPQALDRLGIPVIHPSTDCEFSGTLPLGTQYSKDHVRDAVDAYGASKARASAWIERTAKNTKIIRTSIIGHELSTNNSLLDWFLAQTGTARGYTNHYWNGITTLEWAKQCLCLIRNWTTAPLITQLATEPVNKYQLLCLIQKVYEKDILINTYETESGTNKCLISDILLPSLTQQLTELRLFYGK